MKAHLEIRDPVHNFIPLEKEEARIVNTPLFQRLRGVKQLAMAGLVYPGAIHTRFDHSLGVTHIAGLLAEKLLNGSDHEARRIVRLASLLHDVGHGPFSHVSEHILDRFSPKLDSKIKEKVHEIVTAELIRNDADLRRNIGEAPCEAVIDLLQGRHSQPLERGIVSGPLDADKQDYLLRDSYFCGVKYGVYDLGRMIECLRAHDTGTETVLAASGSGVAVIEQFVLAKYYMTAQVYRHKVRLISDSMIVRALELGITQDGLGFLHELYQFDTNSGAETKAKYLENFMQWDDTRLTTALLFPMGGGKLLSTELFWMLKNRQLFKRVFQQDFRNMSSEFRSQFSDRVKNSGFREELEAQIAERLSSIADSAIPAHHVIVHSYSLKSAREQSRNNEGSILIVDPSGPKKFEDASTLFRSIDERQGDQFVEVYAPFPFPKEDRRKTVAELADSLRQILEQPFQSTEPDVSQPVQP